ncbi:bis(5'-nucleosyl)-tetraphosphatase (symmetrical) YqeK [Tepidimicrobium xylanilyticum]|uniref:bis(5'-nucleosyl)-tetraphosphatase (symmetrical) YqeK n=1 Tax=Tepidimicrobium xylanilyticum TaxID=1123352 RepID=UPI002656E9D9|nr:bis(5'-nucleosyl)-tetraphosphatase (symmetrical) YqeK [Tepidimicrobium xylanilyticum]GMG97240.1 hydrolase [Tepidimicrobium xylanilyticum]
MMESWVYDKLKKDIGTNRFEHSLRVMKTCEELAEHYGCSVEKARIAGLLHDCGKLQGEINLLKMVSDFGIILDNVMKINKDLIHSPLGAEIARRKYKIEDCEILNAIRYHTTGRENMTLLEKIVYIADLIEPGRDFNGVEEIRRLVYEDLDKALLYALDNTLAFIISRGKIIHLNTVKARNHLLILKNME